MHLRAPTSFAVVGILVKLLLVLRLPWTIIFNWYTASLHNLASKNIDLFKISIFSQRGQLEQFHQAVVPKITNEHNTTSGHYYGDEFDLS